MFKPQMDAPSIPRGKLHNLVLHQCAETVATHAENAPFFSFAGCRGERRIRLCNARQPSSWVRPSTLSKRAVG